MKKGSKRTECHKTFQLILIHLRLREGFTKLCALNQNRSFSEAGFKYLFAVKESSS